MDEVLQIPVSDIRPNPYQPRLHFSSTALDELADSIRRHGVLQPVIVREEEVGYVLVAGERRLRAAERAGLEAVPAVVRDLDERQMLEIALVENLQREEISPVEAARAYQRLVEEFGLTHGEIAHRTGKNRTTVANSLRLLQLPTDVLEEVEKGELTEGHARAILSIPENGDRRALCEHILRNGLSVREAERAARRIAQPREKVSRETPLTTPSGTPLDRHLEERLRQRFASRVRLDYALGKGSVTVEFYSDEDLSRILELMGITEN